MTRKSKNVQLVLITAVLASCANKEHQKQWGDDQEKKVYMRSDTTASYSRTHSPMLWFFAFRSFGMYNNGMYNRGGYYSNSIAPISNYGSNAGKRNVVRGGFGRAGFRSSGG